jgi:ATP-dependent DNA helicase RecQ
MVVEHMEEVFGATPYQWQKEVTTHLALMNLPDSGVRSGPVLLVRPTGGGKSSVRDVHGIINGGVSLTITPLLSLGSDQEEKLWSRPNASAGNIVPIHLDEIRSPLEQQNIIEGIKDLPDRHTTVFLFSSPQALVNNNSCWLPLIHWLIDKGRLSMVCVDEVHLFVHFGLTFRKEFQQLTPMLFSKL